MAESHWLLALKKEMVHQIALLDSIEMIIALQTDQAEAEVSTEAKDLHHEVKEVLTEVKDQRQEAKVDLVETEIEKKEAQSHLHSLKEKENRYLNFLTQMNQKVQRDSKKENLLQEALTQKPHLKSPRSGITI